MHHGIVGLSFVAVYSTANQIWHCTLYVTTYAVLSFLFNKALLIYIKK